MCLERIVRKNLFGHRSRNRKVSYLLTIAIAFLIFAGALFALQIKVIGIAVSQSLGADISMTSLDREGTSTDADGNPLLVGLPVEKLNMVLNNSYGASTTDNGVEAWTYITYPLNDMPNVWGTYIGSASLNPRRRSQIYGLEPNFLDVAYNDYVILSGLNGGGATSDVIKDLNNGKNDITLPGEQEETTKSSKTSLFNIVSQARGSTPTCATGEEERQLSVYCPGDDSVITAVRFANFGQPTGVCAADGEYGSGQAHPFKENPNCNAPVEDKPSAMDYFKDRCLGRSECGSVVSSRVFGDPCPGKKKWLSVSVLCGKRADLDGNVDENDGSRGIIVEPPQPEYIEAVLSAAVTDYCSINIDTPFRINTQVGRSGVGTRFTINLGGKPRAYASKMPGFLFSSYQVLANNAPLLIPMEQYAYLAFRTFDFAEQLKSYSEDGLGGGPSTSREETTSGSAGRNDTNSTATNTANSSTSTSTLPSSPSSAGLPFRENPYTSAAAVPKQRLLVRMRSDSTPQQRQILQNALTAVVGSGVSATFSSLVVDTKSLIEETEVANTALTLFLNIIAVIIMILCFLVNLVSFAANVNDNAREFAVLRALGLRSRQVIKVYITEAVVLVTSSFLLGSVIGILVAVSLTLQFNLFIESPFIFNFPTTLFFILAVLGLVVASAAAYFPSNALVRREIAGVLKSG
jgi:hypothetical protein